MSEQLIKNNFLRITRIEKVVNENSQVKTFFFCDKLSAQGKPGQFAMIWLPGFDEIPMSISSIEQNDFVSITVASVGEATRILHRKIKGDTIGVRGPFGRSFKLIKGKVLLTSGGTGTAPLAFLARELVESGAVVTFLLGAKTKGELLFLNQMRNLFLRSSGRLMASTEDGSYGYKGLVTDLLSKILADEKFETIYACGKEQMLFKVFKLAEKYGTPLQASLERLMRCAIGLCGSCTIGRYRVCSDGPVFSSEQLKEARRDFGHFKRDFDGSNIPV
ncbi:MAG: dihydroorotate dehydrogenase electron transfer subunit [Candidatus Bathyarchaeota archaeon]|nr:MAG: dihydroorotate dehydrogenase electron transfer subunit [Candidatus Bathyarchaeota archaeon]